MRTVNGKLSSVLNLRITFARCSSPIPQAASLFVRLGGPHATMCGFVLMAVRTVLVCETQVPLVRGGAELLVQQLVDELRARGFEADKVALPFKWYPKEEILPHAAAWGLLDLSESNGRPIDLVIATKFPTYLARHPRKVCWLVHQHRAVYELASTPYSDFGHTELDVALRDRLMAVDERALRECVGRYTISHTVTARLVAVQRPRLHAALSSAVAGASSQPRPVRQLRAVRGQARNEQAGRPRRALGGALAAAADARRRRRRRPPRATWRKRRRTRASTTA